MCPSCERCGACCAYEWCVQAAVGEKIHVGHLRDCDHGNDEGYLRWQAKSWLDGHRACIFLTRSGCSLHDDPEQPLDCRHFNCRNPHDDTPLAANPQEDSDFIAFRIQWIKDGWSKHFIKEKK
jgi:hypothetical protein